MKICFIALASNYHTIKWANWFSEHGHDVYVVSFADAEIPNVTVYSLNAGISIKDSDLKKLKVLLYGGALRKAVKEINPDIVNVHYATSYGTVAALSGLKGYILSVWGSDVYDFPKKSILHRTLLKYSLWRADYIFSTSKAMANETHKYTKKHVDITPFGVDTELFNPSRKNAFSKDYVIGTVKALHPKYGIEYLLRAASIVLKDRPDIPLKVRIAGKGLMENEHRYKNLCTDLGMDKYVTWLGFIPQEDVAQEWANMDVGIIPSVMDSESFGVSAVEAEACGTPVIISDIPGLMEATKPGVTSVVVKRKNEEELASAIIQLYDNPNQRITMGRAGRQFVENEYELNMCFHKVENLFKKYKKRGRY